jgi:hypothetical protein
MATPDSPGIPGSASWLPDLVAASTLHLGDTTLEVHGTASEDRHRRDHWFAAHGELRPNGPHHRIASLAT